jgi:ribosome-binding factor A
MSTRRQEKMARVVRDAVIEAVRNLSDPRITSFVSITRIKVAADMRLADVYFSFFGGSVTDQNKTFTAIEHSRIRIQSFLAGNLNCRFCPILRFHKDEDFKKTLEAWRIIDEEAAKRKEKEQKLQQ